MEFSKVLATRQSKRWFSDKALPTGLLEELIAQAQQSPSWINSQSIQVTIAKGDKLNAMRKQHAELNHDDNEPSRPYIPFRPISEWEEPAQFNMKGWFGDVQAAMGDEGSAKLAEAGDQLYNAQAVVYLTLPKNYSEWALIDLGLFADTLLLAATDAGLGSIPAYQYVQYPDKLQENLGLDENRVPILGIGLGYADDHEGLNKIHSQRMPLKKMLNILD
ncbi:nitroreductase [Fructobacillus sp. M2-14]|uniref:Nitroreductase n=1 Tax=Fructobacillus broussonetiae TaxID=2713173 RepID=A0ABS5R225_9LACO|nr:nitroreductase [Fructobacillus broussonetiae]MBS9338202.1 nitroreductase [Fructobacillus broussonetiae]